MIGPKAGVSSVALALTLALGGQTAAALGIAKVSDQKSTITVTAGDNENFGNAANNPSPWYVADPGEVHFTAAADGNDIIVGLFKDSAIPGSDNDYLDIVFYGWSNTNCAFRHGRQGSILASTSCTASSLNLNTPKNLYVSVNNGFYEMGTVTAGVKSAILSLSTTTWQATPLQYFGISGWNKQVDYLFIDVVNPTPSPTPSPTMPPPPAVGANTGPISATGDPHLQNIHGERFDLMRPGKYVLISIPRGAPAGEALLRVQADARRLGGSCADMYFQELNITGSWAEAKQAGGYHHVVSHSVDENPAWVAFGKIELKVVHGHTQSGLKYLNVYVKHLGRSGFAVGGLLGEDDHSDVTMPMDGCGQFVSLVDTSGGKEAHVASTAIATSD